MRFWRFPPPDLVRFRRRDGMERPLELGDEMEVWIRGAGRCGVRVVHRDENSLTMATLAGHPEAGRITFGAYRNLEREVVFHIRSRARAGSHLRYLGFLLGGDPMQTNTWGDFVNRLAFLIADGVDGFVHVQKRRVAMLPTDVECSTPTFVAQGD